MRVDTPVVVLGFHHGSLGIARSLGRLGIPVVGVDRNRRAPALASRYLRERHIWDLQGAAPADTVAWLDALARRLAGAGGPPILIPTSDDTALLVAEHADALSQRFRFPRVSPDLIRSFSDKKALFFLAQQLGIPTAGAVFPQSTQDVQRFLDDAVFPVMLKGIDGTRLQARTGTKMAIVKTPGELLQRYRELEDPEAPNLMLQEYIPGGDDTIWMFNGYFNARSECLAAFTGKKLRQHPVHVGATSLGIQLANPTVERLTVDFMGAVGYRGILDIGYRFDARDGLYKLLDPNPRVGQTFRLFLDREGMDVVRCLYLDLTGQPVPPVVPREGRKWIVEDKDVESCLDYRREGQLSLRAWRESLRGVEEGAWFARDDWAPFRRIAVQFAGKVARWVATRLGRGARRLLWEGPRQWWGESVNRRIKSALGAFIYRTGMHRRVFRDHAVILCFHRVDDRFAGDFLTQSRREFTALCDFFGRYFRVVSLGELLDRLRRGDDIGGRLVLTFDDGYRDNRTIVAEELRRRGWPGTFFVATELIGSDFIPSWDVKCGVRTEWMTWDDVRALHAAGFEIGSHTMHHVDLGKVSGAAAEREIVCARERLEKELGTEARLFSYPYGQRDQMTEANRDLVRGAGYVCCLAGYGGLVPAGADPFRLERTGVTPWHRSPEQLGYELLGMGRRTPPGPPVPA